MKRLVLLVGVLGFAACGGGDDGDMMGESNAGFVVPDVTATAWTETGGSWVEQGPANFSCLNTPTDDVANTVEITLNVKIEDFQSGNDVPMAEVTVFDVVDVNNPFETGTADENGDLVMTIPAGHTRIGFEVNADGQMRTLFLNQYLDPGTAVQSLTIGSISELTANALPAFIGVTRTAGRGVLAGALRDCDNNEVKGTIATVSSVSGMPTHLDGDGCTEEKPCTQTYYFSAGSTSLPVRHSQQIYTNSDGLFMAIELPPLSASFLQVWGFLGSQDPTSDDMTLLAEIPSPVFADTIVTFSLEPLRQ